jgi:hypothetical protein
MAQPIAFIFNPRRIANLSGPEAPCFKKHNFAVMQVSRFVESGALKAQHNSSLNPVISAGSQMNGTRV